MIAGPLMFEPIVGLDTGVVIGLVGHRVRRAHSEAGERFCPLKTPESNTMPSSRMYLCRSALPLEQLDRLQPSNLPTIGFGREIEQAVDVEPTSALSSKGPRVH